MDYLFKPLTEPTYYIYLSGIFLIIFGAIIGITPPDSRKSLHTSIAIPLFISLGLINIFRSFDFLAGLNGFVRINAFLQSVAIICGIELGRQNLENAFGKKKFSGWWYILIALFLFYLSYEYDFTKRLIRRILILFSKLFSIVVTIKAAQILPTYNRKFIRSGFILAFIGSIIQFLLDLNFITVTDGHYNILPPQTIYLFYIETALALAISSFILTRRYLYEKSQRQHVPNTISLMSPIVVFITSIIIALGVLIGSNLVNIQEASQQNLESQSYNLNVKNALDFAILSTRLISENPLVSKYLTNPNDNDKNSLKKLLLSFNKENPNYIIYLMDSKGNVFLSSEEKNNNPKEQNSSHEYFTSGIKGISKFSIVKGRNNQTMFFADSPIFSYDGKTIIGVTVLKLEVSALRNIINLNKYPTMIIDTKNKGRIVMSNDLDFLNQECGDIKEYIDKGTMPVSKIPILSVMTNKRAFFTISSLSSFDLCVLSLSNVSHSATTQIWLLFIALLVTFILYIVLYGIAYNSEKLKTIETAQSNFQLIFNHTPDPICVIDEKSSIILSTNKSMQKAFGYEESLVGKKLDDMIVATTQFKYNIPVSQDVVISECRFKKANSEFFTAEITASFIEYADKEALLLNIHDISMFKEIEEKLTEANQVKSRLLSNASHELRTPMTALIGLSELAVSICNDTNQRQIVELLRTASKSLMSLVNDIFNLTEVQSGKFNLKKTSFKLQSLLDEIIEYTNFLAKKSNKNILFKTIKPLPEYINTDSDHLRQTLLAIVDYASDICVNNNTLVNIEFCKTSENKGDLSFVISGINREKREEIETSLNNKSDYADPYHSSITRKFVSGISLHALILKQMGGSIDLDDSSVIPETISLKIRLPIEVIKDESLIQRNPLDNKFFYYKGKPLNLLVADDNDVNLFLVESIVNRFKGKCQTARDGVEVLEILKEKEFDGILLDIQMPKMDGMETLKRIRKMSGKVSEIPVIAVSAFASEDEKKKILEAGAQKYLGKPYFPKDLQEAISSVFELDKEIPELPKSEVLEDSSDSVPEKEISKNDLEKDSDFMGNMKRIDYPDFKVRINPNAKSILKLEEIYNRRYRSLNIEVDNAINNNDSMKLREVAHSIKGLVGMMSAKESWEIAKEIELKAGEGNMEAAIDLIGELRTHLSEISDDLKIIKEFLTK